MTIIQRVRALPIILFALIECGLPTTAVAQQCQPGIDAGWEAHRPAYDLLWETLVPNIGTLTSQLVTATSPVTYSILLASARSIASAIPNGRLVVTLADGTVAVDTSHPDGDAPATANSYAHFVERSINVNQNTRLSTMAAQMFPCGVAIETNADPIGIVESHFATRLGAHLNSVGTARLSLIQAGPWDY